MLPGLRFSREDEQLFPAARHGDRAGIEPSLQAGAGLNDHSPVDGKTALFRAAVFGHTDAVTLLLDRGADPDLRGSDGKTALEVVRAAREEEKDPGRQRSLDAVASAL